MRAWALAIVLAPPTSAAPPDHDHDFHWDAPEGCPTVADVASRLGALDGDAPPLHTQADVSAVDGGFSLALTMTAGATTETRTLTAVRCDTLLDAALLSYGLALEEVRAAEESPATPDDDGAGALVPEPTVSAPGSVASVTTDPAPRPSPTVHGVASVGVPDRELRPPTRSIPTVSVRPLAQVGLGPLGLGSVAFGGAFGLEGLHWRAEISGTGALPREVRLQAALDSGARLTAWAVGARGCGVLRPLSRLAVPLCGGLDTGSVRADGFGVVEPRRPSSAHASAQAAAAAAWAMHPRVRLWLEGRGGVALARAGFVVDGASAPLHRAPLGVFAAELGLELRLGGPVFFLRQPV